MSNDDGGSVNFHGDKAGDGQYGKQQVLSKKQGTLKPIIYLSIVGLTVIPFLTNTREYSTAKVLGIKPPDSIKTVTIEIPTYDLEAALTSEEDKPKRQKPRPVVYYSGPTVIGRPIAEQILPGSMIKAELVSGASNGLIKAKSIESLLSLGNEVIPSGSIFIGSGSPSKHRLQVRFSQVVLPDGNIQEIQAIGADISDKISGLKGSKLGHYGWKLAASTGLHFAAGLSQGLRENDVQGGVPVQRPDMKNAALNGVSLSALELAKETMSDVKSEKPTYNIPFGTKLYILFGGK